MIQRSSINKNHKHVMRKIKKIMKKDDKKQKIKKKKK